MTRYRLMGFRFHLAPGIRLIWVVIVMATILVISATLLVSVFQTTDEDEVPKRSITPTRLQASADPLGPAVVLNQRASSAGELLAWRRPHMIDPFLRVIRRRACQRGRRALFRDFLDRRRRVNRVADKDPADH